MAETIHQITITGPQISQTLVLAVGTTTIGRQPENDLPFVHPLVSRHHATLECTAETCHITDLGSTHGTMVNRLRLEPNAPTLLNPGDVVEIGAFRMVYAHVGAAETQPSPESAAPAAEEPSAVEPEAEQAAAAAAEPAPSAETPASSEAEPEPEPAPPPPQPAPRRPAPAPPSSASSWSAARLALTAAHLLPQEPGPNGQFVLPPGLSLEKSRYLEYLPEIYHAGDNSFISRFLALLESIMAPIEWNIDNFDLYLDPEEAVSSFLPWLANWFELTFDETWSEEKQRELLVEAHSIYERRGTAWALKRLLQIYTGVEPEIDDQSRSLDPYTFTIRLPMREQEVNRTVINQLIESSKPAHTSYTLFFRE